MPTHTKTTPPIPPGLRSLDMLAKLMDAQFRIPGTNIRFGMDAVIGLVPGVGDFASFVISAFMVSSMAKNGASGFVLARMILNIAIDGLVGAIPILGDIFDVGFKANQRNMKLMREHYKEGKHKGGAWKVVLPVLLVFLLLMVGIVWLIWKLVEWLF